MATPTSANTASHMVAKPTAANTNTANFTPSAKTMFCHTMRMVLRAMRIAEAILEGLSSIRTMSAASIAASDPIAPMAMPISARVSTGASLMPSPTKASFPFSDVSPSRRSTWLTLSSGRSLPWYSSSPSFSATAFATSARSPVSMTVFLTPAACKRLMHSAASSLTTSAIMI